ncbi:MAG TPA: hypothetical protein VFF06_34600 [Polyangia bacterium]|nr:hypothetical protein [Polyangia bacterium]
MRRASRMLAGFMSPAVANGYASALVIDGASFIAACQSKGAYCANLPPRLEKPRVEDPPVSALSHIQTLRNHPAFNQFYGSCEIKMVELGKLIACQYWVDTDVSDGVHGSGLQGPPDESQVFSKCLPVELISGFQSRWQVLGKSIVISSMNNTITANGPVYDPNTGEVKFWVSPSPNLMLVREHQGRYVLANGYHRAWLLRSRKVNMVPVVMAHMASEKEVVPDAGFIEPHIIFGQRPPIVDDFFDDSVSVSAEMRSMLRAVRIGAEVLPIPRLI